MTAKIIESRGSGRAMLATGPLLGLVLAAGPSMGADPIDPEADNILRSMSTYLGGLPAFSASADVDTEIIDLQGQKLQLSSSAKVTVERPGNLHVRRQGTFADAELIFDGNVMTIHGSRLNAFTQLEIPGTIDDALETVRTDIGLDMPAADLLYSDPYPALSSGVVSSSYLGTALVNGIECHHLAFREATVDWQLWVRAGDDPLPMKYVITTKWLTGAPQYAVRFRDWNTQPQIKAGQFAFSAPEGARKVEAVSVDEVGELIIREEQ